MEKFDYSMIKCEGAGNDTWNDLPIFYELCIQKNAQKILEIGVGGWGISTQCFLKACQNTGGKLTSVDIQPYGHYFTDPNWTFIHCNSNSAEVGEDFDVILIDGAHDTKSVLIDMERYIPKLKTNGYLIMHDTFFPDVQMAILKYMVSHADIQEFICTKQNEVEPYSTIYIKR